MNQVIQDFEYQERSFLRDEVKDSYRLYDEGYCDVAEKLDLENRLMWLNVCKMRPPSKDLSCEENKNFKQLDQLLLGKIQKATSRLSQPSSGQRENVLAAKKLNDLSRCGENRLFISYPTELEFKLVDRVIGEVVQAQQKIRVVQEDHGKKRAALESDDILEDGITIAKKKKPV